MKSFARCVLVIGLLAFSLVSIACAALGMFVPTPTPTNTPTRTPTPTATVTPTNTSTPTPVPAVFKNRPSYLEKVFSDTGWVWKDSSTSFLRFGSRRHDSKTMISLFYDSDSIVIGGIWDRDTGDFDFVDGFFPIAMQDFLPSSVAADIIQFKDDKINNAPGNFKATIDGFNILFAISENSSNNTRTVLLSITEGDSYR